MGKNIVQAQAWLEKYYPNSAPSKTTIKRWFADFKHGRTDTDDAKRTGRPNEAVISENIEKKKPENHPGQSQSEVARDS